jgi:hypothetical protein
VADGPYGARDIFIDLTLVGPRVIRDVLKWEQARVVGLTIKGTTGAGAGNIVLRSDSASGNIVYDQPAPGGTSFDGDPAPFEIMAQGLYMDALANAWTAGSLMIIHTR